MAIVVADVAALAPVIAATIRNLRRSPGFVAIAALSLGMALGLSTAVFGFIDAIRHPESAMRDADNVYTISFPRRYETGPTQQEVYESLKNVPVIGDLVGYRSQFIEIDVSDRTQLTRVVYTRARYWELLGIHPRIGRLPSAAEANEGSVSVVSDDFWRKEFGNVQSIGPAKITVEGRQYSVVGVLPRNVTISADVFIPDTKPETRGEWIVRLKRGADSTRINQQLVRIAKRFTELYKTASDRGATFFYKLPLRSDPLELKDYHRAIIGAAVAILMIACANVAALMLARGMVRRRDYALQLALGAPTATIFREVIVEVVVLTIIGCVVGAVVAAWTVSIITRATPVEFSWLGFVTPQWSGRVLAQSAMAVFISITIAGGFPAWRASRIDPAGPLKDSSGGNTGRISTRFRLLVMGELALAMTLLVSTSLMMKSVRKMEHYDFGYAARGLSMSNHWFWGYDTSAINILQTNNSILAAIRALPTVQAASTLKRCSVKHQTVISDRTAEGGANIKVGEGCSNVSGSFFTTLGIPLISGRDFSEGDAANGGAAILDEKTARALFPHEAPVGRQIRLGGLQDSEFPWLRVVGVVPNKRLGFNYFPEMGPDSSMMVYISQLVQGGSVVTTVFRTKGDVAKGRADVGRTIRSLLPTRRYVRVQSWTQDYEDILKVERFLSSMFAVLGLSSLILGAAGLFSVISYIANQRNREFAVRLALGAPAASVLRLVMRDALTMSLGGTAIGAGAGMWAGFMLWDKMWGVYPVDVGALLGAEVALLAVTMLACLAPAIRASRADPLEIIRAS